MIDNIAEKWQINEELLYSTKTLAIKKNSKQQNN